MPYCASIVPIPVIPLNVRPALRRVSSGLMPRGEASASVLGSDSRGTHIGGIPRSSGSTLKPFITLRASVTPSASA